MERKKTQATTAKLKKVQTEIKKTKDKLNKLMAEEERLTVQYQTESYEETLAYLEKNRQQDEPDGSCLLEVFAEGFPVGTEDIRLLIFDHLQRDVVHCCEIGADCHNRDTHNKENNVQHHQVEDTAHNLRELTVQAEKTHNLFLFSVELSVPPINVPAGRHHRKV